MKNRAVIIFICLIMASFLSTISANSWKWKQIKPIYGSFIRNLKILPSGKVVAMARNSGIFMSDIFGRNWRRIFPVSDTNWESYYNILAAPDGTIYVSVDPHTIKRSTDEGLTWKVMSNLPTGRISEFTANEDGILYITTETGTYRSNDSGNYWNKILWNNTTWIFNPSPGLKASGSNVVVYTNYGFFISKDYGNCWTQVNLNSIYSQSIAIINQNEIYLSLTLSYHIYPYEQNAIFRTLDGGITWSRTDAELPINCILTITPGPQNNLLVGANNGRIFESTDKGITWKLFYTEKMTDEIKGICSNGKDIYAYGNGIIKSSNNGADWTRIDEGFALLTTTDLIEINNNTLLIRNGLGLYSYDKSSQGYYFLRKENVGTDTRILKRLADKSIFAGNFNGEIYRSFDSGLTWKKSLSPNRNGPVSLAQNRKGYLVLASYGDDFYRSKSNGETWESVGYLGYAAKIICDSNNTFFAAIGNFLYVSRDDGSSWQYTNFFGFNMNGDAVSATKNSLFVLERSGLSRSIDGGITWDFKNNKSFGLGNTDLINSVCEIEPTHLLLATDLGLFESTNDGITWSKTTDEISNYKINFLFKGESGNIYASTNNGLFEMQPTTTSIRTTNLPAGYELNQNYPNPFNPETVIEYKIPKEGFITLKVYDLLGREVAVLTNEFKQAGTHRFQFSIYNYKIPSGVYLYTLKAGDYFQTRKMIFLK